MTTGSSMSEGTDLDAIRQRYREWAPDWETLCPDEAALVSEVERLRADNRRLRGILDQPDPAEFMYATEVEMRYQQAHWGEEHDSGKVDADWFWLIGYLAGKALHRGEDDGRDKLLHRITTVSAAAGNWHRHVRTRASSPEETS